MEDEISITIYRDYTEGVMENQMECSGDATICGGQLRLPNSGSSSRGLWSRCQYSSVEQSLLSELV